MGQHQSCAAAVPAELLDALATRLGAVVRTDAGDPRILAAILTGHGRAVLTLNATIVGTIVQDAVERWAETMIWAGIVGFHLMRATD